MLGKIFPLLIFSHHFRLTVVCICRDSTFRIWAILFVHCPNSVMESRQNRVDCNIFQGQFHFFQSRNQHFCRIFLQKSTQNYHFTTKFYKKMMWKSTFFKNIFTKINTKSSFHNKILQKSDVEMNI